MFHPENRETCLKDHSNFGRNRQVGSASNWIWFVPLGSRWRLKHSSLESLSMLKLVAGICYIDEWRFLACMSVGCWLLPAFLGRAGTCFSGIQENWCKTTMKFTSKLSWSISVPTKVVRTGMGWDVAIFVKNGLLQQFFFSNKYLNPPQKASTLVNLTSRVIMVCLVWLLKLFFTFSLLPHASSVWLDAIPDARRTIHLWERAGRDLPEGCGGHLAHPAPLLTSAQAQPKEKEKM